MARMPGALWKPVTKSRAARRKGRGICLHVAVSEAASLQGFFSGSTSDSHFYVRRDGTIEQYVDTDLQAYANAAGNASLISVETQGGMVDADREPWTPQQVDALARIVRWSADVDGFPIQPMPDSLPTSRGVGYHRLGVKPWAVAGGELWSSSVGKICPGAGKIAQIPEIVARAKQLGVAQPAPASTPADPSGDDELNAYQDAVLMELLDRVKGITFPKPGKAVSPTNYMPLDSLRTESIADGVSRLEAKVEALLAAQKGLVEIIARQAGGQGVDVPALVEQIGARVDAAVSDHAKLVKVAVSVDGQNA